MTLSPILVLCGGQSAEHEISLISARNVVSYLDKTKYKVSVAVISHEGVWHYYEHAADFLSQSQSQSLSRISLHPGSKQPFEINGNCLNIDCVFPVLHGTNGEDGTAQGLLEMLNIPYVGADCLASAIGMDKAILKKLLRADGLPVVPHLLFRKQEKNHIQHIGVLFQFEEKIYQKENIPVTFVGHPLAEKAKASMSKEAAYDFFKLDPDKKIVALFPGSRHSELNYNLQTIIDSVAKIRLQQPDTQFILMLAPHFKKENLALPDYIHVTQSHLYDLLSITDAAIAVSGTITLEIGLMGVPLCALYRSSPLSIWIAKKLVKTPYISLCNIVAEKAVVKEFIQEMATTAHIATEISRLLTDDLYATAMREALGNLHAKIMRADGVPRFTQAILASLSFS